jgi:S-adenosylmethionine:tRNA ribosyltransferase-isomerase
MQVSEFDFALPPDRVAQSPVRPRDAARLLAPHLTPPDRTVRDLPTLLEPGDLLVANDTRVIPAQLSATRPGLSGGARIGLTLDAPAPDGTWRALARNARRLSVGDTLTIAGGDLRAEIVALDGHGGATLRFDRTGRAFDEALRSAGRLALPPYIDRPDGPTEEDAADYQTAFARADGAVAAPTAGLHFTQRLLDALERRGVERATVTLHVGAGTFLPMREDDVTRHRMHAERGHVGADAVAAIERTRARGGRVVAVGTTTLRILETAATEAGRVMPFEGETSIFIVPGFRFQVVDLLMTNFHLPRSTLFMLVCAFAGSERMRAAYRHAIETGYRFYSYGDASLLARAP